MQINQGQTWRFRVQCRGAERVYLVREPEGGPSAWVEMHSDDGSDWEVVHRLGPGNYRFRYFRADGTTFVNCGDHGLIQERLAETEIVVPAAATRYAIPA